MKKIMSVIIMGLCTWLCFLFPPEVDRKITIGFIPVTILTFASVYFLVLCISQAEDDIL